MTTLPAFVYDDVCPMCRGYTSVFASLGWADRTAFSTIDATAIAALDMDRARHEIPLYDKTTESVTYGLDGILPLLADRMPFAAPVLRAQPTRRALDKAYWLITYNRRHIVSAAPPPPDALDCAPDFNPASVGTYVGLSAATTAGAALAAGAVVPVAAAAVASAAFVASREPKHGIVAGAAAGHAATITTAGALAGLAARMLGAPAPLVAVATVAVAARKLSLRRWMVLR